VLCSRVPLYQAMYSTIARRAMARADQAHQRGFSWPALGLLMHLPDPPGELSVLPLRARQRPVRAGTRVPLGLLDLLPHRGLSQVEVPRDLAYRRIPPLAQLHDLGLELRVNERRGRGFFLPMLSIVGHPSGGGPLMIDVRQSGSGPRGARSRTRPVWPGERERQAVLAWVGENLTQVRRSVYGQRLLYWSLGIGFVVGLAAHVGGYLRCMAVQEHMSGRRVGSQPA
jgi:hypothetical protein